MATRLIYVLILGVFLSSCARSERVPDMYDANMNDAYKPIPQEGNRGLHR